MKEYHKIQTLFKRDPATKFKFLLKGEFALPEFEYLAGNVWRYSEKINGTCIRVMFDGERITFGGKTDRAQIPANLVTKLQERFLTQVNVFEEFFSDGVCLYGEGYGPGIQKGGGNYREDQDFVLFDVKIDNWWLQCHDVEDIAQKFGLDVVPIIGSGTLSDMVELVRDGFNSQWGDFQAEGIVARPSIELQTRGGKRVITKLKCKDFRDSY